MSVGLRVFTHVASLYDATAFAWGFCRASHHGILVKREWVTNCVVKSSGFFGRFRFLVHRTVEILLESARNLAENLRRPFFVLLKWKLPEKKFLKTFFA